MHPGDEIQAEALNRLLAVNNNRAECLSYAQRQAGTRVFKSLFASLAETSECCREALSNEIYKLGGKPFEGTLCTDDFIRVWQEINTALKSNDHFTILSSMVLQEGVVLRNYSREMRLGESYFNSIQFRALNEQYEALKADAEKASNLREVMVSALVRDTVKAEMAKMAASQARMREVPPLFWIFNGRLKTAS